MQQFAALTRSEESLMEDVKALAIVRVADTPAHARLQQWLVEQLEGAGGWTVERDTFLSDTPFGPKTFTNIIATQSPSAKHRVVVAAHYESKYFEEPNEFVGATDSAAPCALLLDLAKTLSPSLDFNAKAASLQLIFFDGEEAFKEWTDTDSLYGSRHLAEKWEEEEALADIQLFVLLDVLGHANTRLYSFHKDTEHLFARLSMLEKLLKDQITKSATGPYFQTTSLAQRNVQDDHVPFEQRGVPVIHLIGVPFPPFWHTTGDNFEKIHGPTLQALSTTLRVFIAECLHLKSAIAAPLFHSSLDPLEASAKDIL
ncbi:glutaminyl-peptide cyclotransferase, variant 2 [Balamuthia mandrillaris]